MNENKSLTILVVGILVTFAFLAFIEVMNPKTSDGLGGNVIVAINTWQAGTTNATTTINTTSTQVIASTTKWARISNPSTSTVTCSLDDRGTTAASSSVAANKGIIIGPSSAASSTAMPPYADFGECNTGDTNCIPFKGTLNCVASAQSVVSVVSK